MAKVTGIGGVFFKTTRGGAPAHRADIACVGLLKHQDAE
jgi:hypothetical protein